MKKVLAFILCSLLLAQSTWAAVASYCGHEVGSSSQHIGHHSHQHDNAQASAVAESDFTSTDLLLGVDQDCASCHFAQTFLADSLLLSETQSTAYDPPHRVSIHLARSSLSKVERPKWFAAEVSAALPAL